MNIKYFWVYRTDLPPNIGIKTFGILHITWVATAILIMALIIFSYRRQNASVRHRIQVAAVMFLVLGYLGRWIWLASIGHYTIVENLPLQLCSISVFVELAAVITGNSVLKEFTYSCSLPGAFSSLIMPGMGSYPFFSFFYLQFAVAHATLVLIPMMWILVDGYRPDLRNLPKCIGLLSSFVALAFFVNSKIGSNYMFLTHSRGNTLMTPFEAWLGYPYYLIPFGLFVLLAWVILYAPWTLRPVITSNCQVPQIEFKDKL